MSNIPKIIKQPLDNLKNITKYDLILKTVIAVSLVTVLLLFFVMGAAPIKYNLGIGDVAYEDVYAPSEMVDKIATEQLRTQAESSVEPEYEYDLGVQRDITRSIEGFFNTLEAVKVNEDLDSEQKLSYLQQQSTINLDTENYKLLLKATIDDINKMEFNINYIVVQILGQTILEDEIEEKKDIIREFFREITEASNLNSVGSEIAIKLIKPNRFVLEEKTQMKVKEARARVADVTIKKGTKIVNKGQEVTLQHIRLLEAYGLLENGAEKSNVGLYIGYLIIILIGVFILGLYIYVFEKKIWTSNNSLIMLSIMFFGALVISALVPVLSDYFIVLPAFIMVISIMLNPRIAIITSVITTIFVAYVTGIEISALTIMLTTGIIGSIMVYKTHHRSTIVYAGIGISGICILLVLSFGLVNYMSIKQIITNMFFALCGGVMSSVLTIGILPFLEATFDIITPIKLLELSNPNQSLLRRLLIEAPGTYYHSILVGNLSEAAAEEVEANSLLCRIGAYYHDIGKLKRPYFFKENQITKENPHDRITPNLSALIITSHIRDGIEYAKKYKLPSSVISIIQQHHGNTLVAYFYHKALNSEGGEQVTEDKFRYPFQKPQSKEAAIVMLADSVEAYIRSQVEPTQEQVEQGVRKIIRDKQLDGQLEQCDLTLKDMENIARAFVKVLAGIFHDRIEYPQNIKDI